MRRVLITAASLFLVAGVVLAAPADAGRGSAAQPTAARSVPADFNQDGTDDLAVGAPFEEVGNAADAGAVSVLYGSAGGLSSTGGRLFTQVGSIPNYFEGFGRALAAGDFNQDGYADLPSAPQARTWGAASRLGRSACCPARPAG